MGTTNPDIEITYQPVFYYLNFCLLILGVEVTMKAIPDVVICGRTEQINEIGSTEVSAPLGQTGLYSTKDGSRHPGAAFWLSAVLDPGFDGLKEPCVVRFAAFEGDVEQIKKQFGLIIDELYNNSGNWENRNLIET